MSLRVSLLGTISVSSPAGPVTIAGEKQQTLLALLALAAPRSVSDQRLIDQLWGDTPPGNPANALQALVSNLRRVVGSDTLSRGSNGYSLRVEPGDVDALRLEQLVRVGRDAAAAGDQHRAALHFEEAVSLVHGPPLAELAERGVVREATSWLEGLVLDAQEAMIDALLATSRHAEVVDRLRSLVVEHPLRERFHAQLMLALYRCGRQSEALAAHRHVREMLLEELGLDPGLELQTLERAVLCHDAALAAPAPLKPAGSSTAPPVPLTSFVGRQTELALLHAAIGASRLVTVVGTAGVGKSRLVLEAARDLAHTREVWYVELAPVTDAVAVPEAVASTVGARDEFSPDDASTPRRPDERTIARLADRPAVLILDNCEHVIEAAATCARTLLAGCRSLAVVATSREPLAVDGELQVALGTLGETDAVQLFTERALTVQPLFRPDDGTDELLQLCQRLDGLPLAIELAAARAKTLPVPEITLRLEHRFELLKSTNRQTPMRHRALSAALDASYELLFETERRAFRTLAVFAGGVTVDAAQDVCGPDALDILSALVDRSMMVADTSGHEARFRMLESLRQYGVERLRQHGELDAVVDAHVRWCIDLAETVDVAIRGPGQLPALDRLDAEHDNLRAALAHTSVADPNSGLRLIGALLVSWFARDRRQEARHWAEACLAGATDPPPGVLALAFAGVGLMPESSGWSGVVGELESELAQARLRLGIQLATDAGDEILASRCKLTLVSVLTRSLASRMAVDPQDVTSLVTEAAEVFERQSEHYFAAALRSLETIWYLVTGDLAVAETAAAAARRHAVRSGDHWSSSNVEWIDGMLLDMAGDARGAYRHIERSLQMQDELGMGHVVVGQARTLVRLADGMGQPELAEQWGSFVQSRTGRAAGGEYDGSVMAAISNKVGLDARREGDLERAKRAHLEAEAWLAGIGVSLGSAFTASCLGFVASDLGDHAGAAIHHGRALDDAEALGEPFALALAFDGAATTFREGEARWAAEVLGAARALRELAGREPETHVDDVLVVERRARAELGDEAFDAAVCAEERPGGVPRRWQLCATHRAGDDRTLTCGAARPVARRSARRPGTPAGARAAGRRLGPDHH